MAGARLVDGFSTKIEFGNAPGLGGTIYWEKEVQPPGYDGGGMIDITSMRNTEWRTRIAKALVTLTEITISAGWHPNCYDSIFDLLNVNQLITIELPDGGTVVFAGWVNTFIPGSHQEGVEPVSSINIIPSNINPADGVSELAPVYTEAA